MSENMRTEWHNGEIQIREADERRYFEMMGSYGLRIEGIADGWMVIHRAGEPTHLERGHVLTLAMMIDRLRERDLYEGLSNTGPLYERIIEVLQDPDLKPGDACQRVLKMAVEAREGGE